MIGLAISVLMLAAIAALAAGVDAARRAWARRKDKDIWSG